MSTPEPRRLQRIESIYHDAVKLDATALDVFLDEACGDDKTLRRDVKGLLAARARADSFMETDVISALGLAAKLDSDDHLVTMIRRAGGRP